MELFVFYFIATVTVGSALAVVFTRRAVYSALWLIVCFGSIAALFIQMEAFFLGAIQIIVYAGAIMVLFLFVIMLLDPKTEVFQSRRQGLLIAVLTPLVIYLAAVLWRASVASPVETGSLSTAGGIEPLAKALFREYLLPFELTSILILVAVLGAIVLAKPHPQE